MSIVIKMFNAIDAQDLNAMAEIMHEEFMYLNDYEIRNKEDWAVTYILDACFNNLINKSEFFPDNFTQRIKKLK